MPSTQNTDGQVAPATAPPSGLEWALHAAQLGFRVFPCIPGKGIGYQAETVNADLGLPADAAAGCHHATTDPDRVRTLWSGERSGAWIGLATGNGLLVVDVDEKKGKSGSATMEANGWTLPATASQRTKSGGSHHLFDVPPGAHAPTDELVQGGGIDRRGDGGHVVLYDPAFLTGRRTNAPDWTLTPGSGRSVRLDPADVVRAPAYDIALEALRSRKPEDLGRNGWLSFSGAFCAATAGLVDDATALSDWQTWNAPHGDTNDPDANARQWANFKRGGTSYDYRQLARMAAPGTAARAWAAFGNGPPPLPPGASATLLPVAANDGAAVRLSLYPPPISDEEWNDTAALTPACIVDNLYFADVGVRVAAGAVGKTTSVLWEAIHIALGWPLYGNAVRRPGVVCILSSEDGRGMLIQRVRKMCEAQRLSPDQLATVKRSVRITYVEQFKLTRVDRDVVVASEGVRSVIADFAPLRPSIIWIDPAVSFGVGESRVNDAEQGLITAARMIRNAIPDCAVMFVHHTGKANAREKTLDQYSGRGGSALADGSRMVQVMQPLGPDEWRDATGTPLCPDESGFVLSRSKLSYAPPQSLVYVRRRGWSFETVEGQTVEDSTASAKALFLAILEKLTAQGRYVNQTSGSNYAPKVFADHPDAGGTTKARFRAAMDALFEEGRITNVTIGTGSRERSVIGIVANVA